MPKQDRTFAMNSIQQSSIGGKFLEGDSIDWDIPITNLSF